MKKRNLWTMTACLALSAALLASCGTQTDFGAKVSASPPPAAEIAVPAAAEKLAYVLERKSQSQEWRGENDVLLAQYSCAVPRLTVETEDGETVETGSTPARRKMLDAAAAFNDGFDAWAESTDFQAIGARADEAYEIRQAAGQTWTEPYDEEFTYTSWQTERLISVAGTYYTDTGGAHPNTVLLGWNFDLETGRFLAATDVAADAERFQTAAAAEIVRQAEARAAEDGMESTDAYWENYRELIAQWPDYAVSFTEGGMTVVFSAYELACYAAGPQEFLLDTAFLKPYLSADGMALLGLAGE